jgi:hypothetical protein
MKNSKNIIQKTLESILGEIYTTKLPSEDEIRERAYFLWEEAGSPDGDGVDFWVRAERELTAL